MHRLLALWVFAPSLPSTESRPRPPWGMGTPRTEATSLAPPSSTVTPGSGWVGFHALLARPSPEASRGEKEGQFSHWPGSAAGDRGPLAQISASWAPALCSLLSPTPNSPMTCVTLLPPCHLMARPLNLQAAGSAPADPANHGLKTPKNQNRASPEQGQAFPGHCALNDRVKQASVRCHLTMEIPSHLETHKVCQPPMQGLRELWAVHTWT